jgi:hypothetical protein
LKDKLVDTEEGVAWMKSRISQVVSSLACAREATIFVHYRRLPVIEDEAGAALG